MSEDHPNLYRAPIAGYVNYFEVGHNAFEFLIDFGQIDPQTGDINLNNRIALGPTHAKILSRLMSGAVSQFETQFGPIQDVHEDDLLGAILDSYPDFERRAMVARRQPVAASGKPSSAETTIKR